jgi:hypothetical protein
MGKPDDEQSSPEETARRRDEAIRRALNTPQSRIVKWSLEAGESGARQPNHDRSRSNKKWRRRTSSRSRLFRSTSGSIG